MSFKRFMSVLFGSALLGAPLAFAQSERHGDGASSDGHRPPEPYPLATCPVTGEKLGTMGAPVVKEYDGREVRFCCKMCVPKFEASKDEYWKKIDAQIVEDQAPFYPVTTCVISGEPLTMDGEDIAVDYVHENRLIRFCCAKCVKEFLEHPDATLAKLDAAVVAQQGASYPLTTCPVSGEALGSMGKPFEMVIDGRLVRLCCAKCEAKVRADPLATLNALDAAWKAKGMPHPAPSSPEHEQTEDHGGHEGH